MINGIFYARFLAEEKGSQIIHQSPPGCMLPDTSSKTPPLLDWPAITEFVIPNQAFCNRYITVRSPCGEYRVLGFPVCIRDAKYYRNEFIFNFGLVVKVGEETGPYEAVVRRLAMTFTEMEMQSSYLSEEGSVEGEGEEGGQRGMGRGWRKRRNLGALLEIIREDLNNYNECMIPVDDATTINMKLFPTHANPPPIKPYHVPITKINLLDILDDRWDLTLRKIIPCIDGIRSVARIASDAQVSLSLTKLALQHLLYYESVLLLDLFFFGNIYAVLPAVSDFVKNVDGMQDECARYVFTSAEKLVAGNFWLCRLMTSFVQGRSVKEWIKIHLEDGLDVLKYVDVRRLVQFGVIKGLLKRVHKYAISSSYMAEIVAADMDGEKQAVEEKMRVMRLESNATTIATANGRRGSLAPGREQDEDWEGKAEVLRKYTDGCHCFDQIIVEQNMTDEQIVRTLLKMKPQRDVQIVYR